MFPFLISSKEVSAGGQVMTSHTRAWTRVPMSGEPGRVRGRWVDRLEQTHTQENNNDDDEK